MLERLVGRGWGTLTIELPVSPLTFGETIEGAVTVEAKRSMAPGLLTLALVCQERQSRVVPVKSGRRISANRQNTHREIWRNEIIVDEDVVLDAGSVITMPWSLDVPDDDPGSANPHTDIPEWAKGTLAVLDNLTMSSKFRQYQLEARFKHPDGFTLRHNLEVHIQ